MPDCCCSSSDTSDCCGTGADTVGHDLTWRDRFGALRVRCGIRRMHYRVAPGLYRLGDPDSDAPVLVTANYKLSFDTLRTSVRGLDAWILVLDTAGVNVWCAAGKGTFGTEELVRRVDESRVAGRVEHRTLIVPQLGAAGVDAFEVQRRTRFRVVYGPVRASDIGAFLAAGMEATPEMRRVRFGMADRAVLAPVEVALWGRWALLIGFVLLALSGLSSGGYSVARALNAGLPTALVVLLAVVVSMGAGPLLLPWLPGRAFSWKGLALGGAADLALIVAASLGFMPPSGVCGLAAWLLWFPSACSFLVMNFTGSTPITSRSGVRLELRRALPWHIAGAALALVAWGVGAARLAMGG